MVQDLAYVKLTNDEKMNPLVRSKEYRTVFIQEQTCNKRKLYHTSIYADNIY